MFRARQEYNEKLQVPKHLYLQMNSDGVQISPGDNNIKIKNQTIKIRPKTGPSCGKYAFKIPHHRQHVKQRELFMQRRFRSEQAFIRGC